MTDLSSPALNRFAGTVRRALDDYQMILEGDRVAVGISGGKDSLLLLTVLRQLQRYYPARFDLEAVTIDLGFDGMDYAPVRRFCEELGVPYTCVPTDIREIVFDARREPNPCSLCAKMRRGALAGAMRERGLNKLALGHHADDAVETFFLSLLMEGRLSCFEPLTRLDGSGITLIRPLIYSGEKGIASLARQLDLPVIENSCPQDKSSKRVEVKRLLAGLSREYPDLKSKVLGSMQRLPLPGWKIPSENKTKETSQ